jgi:hypothetical protein
MKKAVAFIALLAFVGLTGASTDGCETQQSSDEIQGQQLEEMLKEATAQTGMPAIKNFRERKLLKDILELRDQNGLTTYTYVFSEMTATWSFFCDSIGYGVPYATQYTNPERLEYIMSHGAVPLPQADPSGLFSPASAEGTWVMCKDPNGKDVKPVYIEPRVIVSPFKLAPTVLPTTEPPPAEK